MTLISSFEQDLSWCLRKNADKKQTPSALSFFEFAKWATPLQQVREHCGELIG